MDEVCTCTFVAAGEPMQNNECTVHTQPKYACDECGCDNYRPRKAPIPGGGYRGMDQWFACVCGHLAQSHN
jgi:hypothetical protein